MGIVESSLVGPLLALVLWSFVMEAWLYATRIPEIVGKKIVYDPRRPTEEFIAQLSPSTRWKADNYNHLMEQPTLFYAVALVLVLLEPQGSFISAVLAWAYVILRIAHSFVQAIVNKIELRFGLFILSSVVLLALTVRAVWIAI